MRPRGAASALLLCVGAPQLADEAVCIGGAPSSESYLNIPNLLAAAISRGADAIHPVRCARKNGARRWQRRRGARSRARALCSARVW